MGFFIPTEPEPEPRSEPLRLFEPHEGPRTILLPPLIGRHRLSKGVSAAALPMFTLPPQSPLPRGYPCGYALVSPEPLSTTDASTVPAKVSAAQGLCQASQPPSPVQSSGSLELGTQWSDDFASQKTHMPSTRLCGGLAGLLSRPTQKGLQAASHGFTHRLGRDECYNTIVEPDRSKMATRYSISSKPVLRRVPLPQQQSRESMWLSEASVAERIGVRNADPLGVGAARFFSQRDIEKRQVQRGVAELRSRRTQSSPVGPQKCNDMPRSARSLPHHSLCWLPRCTLRRDSQAWFETY